MAQDESKIASGDAHETPQASQERQEASKRSQETFQMRK
jgi:hypothetical protein